MTVSEILYRLDGIVNNHDEDGDYDDMEFYEDVLHLKMDIEDDMNINIPSISVSGYKCTTMILDDCPLAPLQCAAKSLAALSKNKEEGNNPMYNVKTYDDIQFQRDYLRRRVYDLSDKLTTGLGKQFFMSEDQPKNAEEMIARITAGDYTLDEKKAKAPNWGYGMLYGIEWRNKDQIRDDVGYAKASEALDAERQNVLDQVAILDTKDALKVVDTFKTWTYTA